MGIVVTTLVVSSLDFNNTPLASRAVFGNAFYKLKYIIGFDVHTYAIATSNTRIIFAPSGFPDTGYIQDENGGGFFRDFNSGDDILIQSSASNNGTITNIIKIDDNTLKVTARVAESSSTAEIYLAKTYSTVDFRYNLVENNDQPTFASKIDLSTQRYTANNIVAAFQNMTPMGFQSWHLGEVEIIRNGVSATFNNSFQLQHTFYITPFFLREDLLGTFPDYFLNSNCLRYIFQLDVKPNVSDNTRTQTLLFDEEVGNTGWLNENYNSGLTNYYIEDLTFTRVSDSEPLASIQLSQTEQTEVGFELLNTVDSPFSIAPANDIVLNFINVPFQDSEYKQTTTDLSFNFSFDRIKNVVNGSPLDGENARAIKDFEISFVNPTWVNVKFKIDLDLATYNRIAAMETKKFLLAISVQDNSGIATSDGVTIPIAYEDFYIDLGLDAAITVDEEFFIEHPYQDTVDGITTLESFTEDEVVGYKRFKIDTSLASQPFTINAIRAGIRSTDGTNTFKLSEYTIPIQNAPIVNGIEFIDTTQVIPFKAPLTELVTQFKVERDISSDANPIYYYDVYFGWINRWEYWLENADVNSDFFDIAEPSNGLSNNWERYDSLGYDLEFFVEWDLEVDGLVQTLSFESDFTIADYDSNADWDNEDVKTYDSSNNLLTNGGTQYILGYEDTKVVSEFEWVGAGSAPLTSEVEIIMRLEGYQIGGQFGSTRISSARNVGSESQWVSIDLSNQVVITSIGNVLYGTAKIDNFTLQNFETFSITARIYDKRALENCILKEDGDDILLEDESGCILQELI